MEHPRPEKFNNINFFDYDGKAEYLIEHYDLKVLMKKMIEDSIKDIKLSIALSVNTYINEIYYFSNKEEVKKNIQNTKFKGSIKDIYINYMECLFELETKKAKSRLKSLHGIDYDSLEFYTEELFPYTFINNEKISVNDIEGLAKVTFTCKERENPNFIRMLIDGLGKFIEKGADDE